MTVDNKRLPIPSFLRRLWSVVPVGRSLPQDVWCARHRFLNVLALFHDFVIAVLGMIDGYSWEISIGADFRDCN